MYLSLFCLFGRRQHAIFHETALEATVHAFQAVGISDTFEVRFGLENPPAWILDTLDDGMTPSGDGFLDPVGRGDLVHHARIINQFGVRLFRNKVGVTPMPQKRRKVKDRACQFLEKQEAFGCSYTYHSS
jgi:hypothetical protein